MRVIQRLQDNLSYRLKLAQYFIVPESQQTKALPFQPFCALVIASGLFLVLPAVHFDYESPLEAYEVQYVRT